MAPATYRTSQRWFGPPWQENCWIAAPSLADAPVTSMHCPGDEAGCRRYWPPYWWVTAKDSLSAAGSHGSCANRAPSAVPPPGTDRHILECRATSWYRCVSLTATPPVPSGPSPPSHTAVGPPNDGPVEVNV